MLSVRPMRPFSSNVDTQVNPCPAGGFEYDRLTEAVKGFERAGMTAKKRGAVFRTFDSAMEFVDKGGHGVEWAWVRTRNMDAFRDDPIPASCHP